MVGINAPLWLCSGRVPEQKNILRYSGEEFFYSHTESVPVREFLHPSSTEQPVPCVSPRMKLLRRESGWARQPVVPCPSVPFLGALVPQFVSQPLLAPIEHFTLCIALAEAETGCLLFYLAQPTGSGTQDNFFGHKGKTGMK